MKKNIYILIIIFVVSFILCIKNVDASSLECNYKYVFNSQNGLGITIDVIYDGTKVSIKKQTSEFSYITIRDNLPDTIQDTYIKNNQGKLSCPFFSIKNKMTSNGRNVTYDLDFKINEKIDGYSLVEAYNSKIDETKVEDETDTSDILYTCVYNEKTTNKNVFSFVIRKSGYAANSTGLGDYGEYSIIRDTTKSFTICPTYVNSKCDINSKVCHVDFSDTSGNWIYVGAGNTTDGVNTNLVTTYFAYKNSSTKVQIIKDDATKGYRIVASDDAIESSNLQEVSSRIESGDYPKYLAKETGSDGYKFIDSKKDENGNILSFEKIYINEKALGLNGTGLGEEKIYATCNELFGDTLLGFIRNDILPIIWIGVPILLILFTSFDFAKVVFVDDKEGIQHAFQRFIKRAIAALLIFLTPTILVILVDVIGAGDTVQSCIREMRKMSGTSFIIKK